jgi:glyoxylate carboligase|tara:strand:+ start:73 stop:387 length:315 start_codon:yes stop_codon:yes gene_type:complete
MNDDQRSKLATVLLDEALTCSERGDKDDARTLMRQSVAVRFRDEIEKIIKGDFVLLNIFTAMQHDKDVDKRVMARALIHVLIEDKRFLKMYKPKFEIVEDEEDI